MGYNPFDVFRRHQKKLFGVLTIFIMIMFVFNFGAGDFFQWLPKLIGQGSGNGDKVATVNGREVTDGDLGKIQNGRFLASEFMLGASGAAAGKFNEYLQNGLGNASKENKPLFNAFQQAQNPERPYIVPNIMDQQDLMSYFTQPESRLQITQKYMRVFQQALSAVLSSTNSTAEDKDLAKAGMSLIDLDIRRFFNSRAGYFGHMAEGEDTLRAALDFDLWLKKADQLGIKYTTKDAMTLFNDEFFNQLDPETLGKMEQALFAQKQGYNRDVLFQALADEFKVRTAQNVVLGRGTAPQVFPTAYDLYQFYQKQCDGGTYQVVSIPAENYVSRVTGKAEENTLRELFTKYRTLEPDPMKDGVGLKEPRKLKLGWLEAKGDEPFYKKAGADALAAAETHAKLSMIALAPLTGGNFAVIAAPLVMNLKDPALSGAYRAFAQNHATSLDLAWFPSFNADSLKRSDAIDSSILKPANIAAAAAAAAGSLMTHAGQFTLPLVFVERARMEDRNARARALAALLVPMTDAGTNLLGTSLACAALLPGPLPLDVVRNDLLEKVKNEAVNLVAKNDLEFFEKELAKLAADKDKTKAKEYLSKFVTERGLKSGGSQEFRDQYNLVEDPGLKPLVEKQKRGGAFDLPMMFGRSFFFDFDPVQRREMPALTLYSPSPYPEGSTLNFRDAEPHYLTWRTEEVAAEIPKDFDKTRPKVEELWRRLEARKLAAADAEAFAAKVRDTLAKESGGDQTAVIQRVVSNLHLEYMQQFSSIPDKDRTKYFSIDNVSPVSAPDNLFGVQSQMPPRPFQLTPTRDLPFPNFKMQNDLLLNKDKKLSTTIVMNDDAKDNYYVATLKYRQDRRGSEFYEQVYNGTGPISRVILQGEQQEATRDAVNNAVSLLRAEFKVKEEGDKLSKKK
ncbi:hypothetical protein BH11PLA2_BH11PLA2_29580 [soil metagenome]